MLKVVVVHEVASEADGLRSALEGHGHTVTVLPDADALVAHAKAHVPDLAILSVDLPGSHGVAAAIDIRNRFGVPTVFVAKTADRDTVERVKAADPIGLLLTPWREDELMARVEIGLHTYYATRHHSRFREVLDQPVFKEQAQANKMQALGQLASGIAHDFNNLLLAITGYTERLLDTLPTDDRSRRDAEQVQKVAVSARDLTRRLLAFGRSDEPQTSVHDVGGIAADLQSIFRRVIGDEIGFEFVRDAAPAYARVDLGQMEQVLVNLVVNARDATPAGGRIRVEAGPVSLDMDAAAELGAIPGPYARLMVADSGSGIDPEIEAKIFEPFFTTKGPGKGTGLGLSIVCGIIAQSDGYFSVSSVKGRGTTFEVFFPMSPAPSAVAPTVDLAPENLRGTETVLLLEDEEHVREIVAEALEGAGYRVLQASGPVEAFNTIERYADRVDLLLSDIAVPGVRGAEVYERVRVKWPDCRLLLMSGYVDPRTLPAPYSQAEILQKPFTTKALKRKLREILAADTQPAGSLRT